MMSKELIAKLKAECHDLGAVILVPPDDQLQQVLCERDQGQQMCRELRNLLRRIAGLLGSPDYYAAPEAIDRLAAERAALQEQVAVLEARVAELQRVLEAQTQIVHQAYHGDVNYTWRECMIGVCVNTRTALASPASTLADWRQAALDHFQADIFRPSLPEDIRQRAITVLREILTPVDLANIRDAMDKRPSDWWAPYHFRWGMAIRNGLREQVCYDDKLPALPGYNSGNWDDWYIECVEMAALQAQEAQGEQT